MRARLPSLASTALLPLLACALACAGGQGSPAPAAPSTPPAATPAATADAAALRLVYEGTWRSPACGLRNHEQVMALRSDGSFHLEDRISPCPAGAVCVWSGVEAMDGRWQLDGDAIDLAPAAATPAIARPPTRLHWQPAPAGVEAPAGALEDQRGCLFLREVPKPPKPSPQATQPTATPEPSTTPAPEAPESTSPAEGTSASPAPPQQPETPAPTGTPEEPESATPSTSTPTPAPTPTSTATPTGAQGPEGPSPPPPAPPTSP